MPSVLVAMSGGVDSSVAACLLREQGYDVVGSHMRLVRLDDVDHGCCGPSARADAEAVARIAGFPFEVCDLTADFEREVLDDFAAEHAAG
ncbi:MAG TPA: tRNA 2-thiouridine(34) synthase MnmA, partial [Actinomycetota bacterium]|nr:tRNA 2-thiouridine(34) synthase MnmA [Actinomycetota bacterium]